VGEGVKRITPLLNTTRLHNAVNAGAGMARVLQLQRDYARRRTAFGSLLAEKPLHRETLAAQQVEYDAALALTFDAVRLLGRVEAGEATDSERAALRLLTPLAKLMTGKQAVAVCSEGLEGFGGAGYVEDTGLPVLLRNAQVLPIWEGTTNVLSLEALRAIARDQALEAWVELSRQRLEMLRCERTELVADLGRRVGGLAQWLREASSAPEIVEAMARHVALEAARLAAAVPLLERGDRRALLAAERWLRVPSALPPLPSLRDRLAEGSSLGMLEG
jgi:hypothetical protein